jgi:hypothetical protein
MQQPATCPGEPFPAWQSASTMDDGRTRRRDSATGAGFQCRRSKHDGRRPGMACRTHGATNTPRTRFRAPRD